MPSEKPREAESKLAENAISENARDWLRAFVEQLELNFLEHGPALSTSASVDEYQTATITAMIRTLLDSGMTAESLIEAITRSLHEGRSGPDEWNAQLNQRRFKLIDKEIQQTITTAESLELSALTLLMREQLDSEGNLPLDGARALHRRLLQIDVSEKRR